MKQLRDLDVQYVLTPFSQQEIKAGAAACAECAIAVLGLVAGTLTVTVVIQQKPQDSEAPDSSIAE